MFDVHFTDDSIRGSQIPDNGVRILEKFSDVSLLFCCSH